MFFVRVGVEKSLNYKIMQYKKGTSRHVVIFPQLGFVLKFPIIFLRTTVVLFFYYFFKGYFKYICIWFTYETHITGGFKFLIYRGFYENWNEYKFYKSTKNNFLQPTYFSFFGIFNIQKYCEIKKLPSFDYNILRCFALITENAIVTDLHHFSNPNNFCFENGTIKALDYGSLKTQEIISKWSEKIIAEFDVKAYLDSVTPQT